jgi:hypothetical protein
MVLATDAGSDAGAPQMDAETATDAASAPDTPALGDDAAAATDSGADVDVDAGDSASIDGGTTSITVHGSLGSVGGAVTAGSVTVVDQGFETGGLACASATCVMGGIVP